MVDDISQNCIPIISGSGRSGTTWVQDVLAQSNDLRTAFEPLHPAAVPGMQQYANSIIESDEVHLQLETYLSKNFKGDFRSLWVDYRVRPDRLMPYPVNLAGIRKTHEYFARWRKLFRQKAIYRHNIGKPVITKFIRANLMYSWILKHFEAKIVHIIRHPCAVIESKLRLGGDDWDVDQELVRYLQQQPVYNWVSAYMSSGEIDSLTIVGRYALIWCIENTMPLLTSDSRILKVYFESLAGHDDSTWKMVCAHLQLEHVPGAALMSKPSQQARPENRDKIYGRKMTSSWRERMADNQIKEIEDVLLRFNITEYSVSQSEPLTKG